MKFKITSILALLAASVFAFAETATENTAPANAEKPVVCEKGKPECPKARKDAFVMHILLSLKDEQLDNLAKRVAEVRAMTPEKREEARKALPKPQMRPMPGKHFRGKPDFQGKRCGQKPGHPGKHFRGKPGKRFHGKPGPKGCPGIPFPPPPQGKPEGKCAGAMPPPPPPAQPQTK